MHLTHFKHDLKLLYNEVEYFYVYNWVIGLNQVKLSIKQVNFKIMSTQTQTNSNFVASEETVARILGRATVVATGGAIENILITNISEFNPQEDGERWRYEPRDGQEVGDAYAIVNFRMLTEYGMAEALRLYEEGEYLEALNQTMSCRVPLEQLNTIAKGLRVTVQVESVFSENVGEDILVAQSIIGISKAKVANNPFAKLQKVNKPKDEVKDEQPQE